MRYNNLMSKQPGQPTEPTTGYRILIIRNASVHDFGGGERFPVDLAVELRSNGHLPIVVSRSPMLLNYARGHNLPTVRGWWWQRQNWSGIRIALTPIYFLWQCVLSLWYLWLISKLQPDVIHAQSKDDFIAATIAGKLRNRRIIWTDHADLKYIYANHGIWYKNPVGKVVAWVSHFADTITLVSHSEERLVAAALGIDQLPAHYRVIHNGITDQTVELAVRADIDKSGFVYCATSRLVGAKGIRELIEAFNQLRSDHADVSLWLAGDGPEAEKFKANAQNKPGVTFLGHVDQPLPLVAAADVFVHPSYHEGFSLSLVEAAMLSKPIIACNVGGNPEIISDMSTGLLIPPQDSGALYEAMLKLYNDRKLASKLGSNARATYEKSFRFNSIVAEEFIPLYKVSA